MNNPQVTAQRIKELATKQQITITKLLNDCELNKNTLSTMLSGKFFPRVETLCKIADYLNCSVDYLLGRTNTSTLNEDIQIACKVTNLSEDAIKAIKNIHNKDPYRTLKRDRMYNSEILLSNKFKGFLSRIGGLKKIESTLPDGQLTLKCTAPDSNGLQFNLTKKDLIEYDLQLGFDEFKNIIEEIIKETPTYPTPDNNDSE